MNGQRISACEDAHPRALVRMCEMRRCLAAVLLTVAVLAACSSHTKYSASPFDAKADRVVKELAAGQADPIVSQFDATMRDGQNAEKLTTAWRTYEERFGQFVSAERAKATKRGDLTVERVTVKMAHSAGEIRVTYHPDGTIAGLYFLKPGVPVP